MVGRARVYVCGSTLVHTLAQRDLMRATDMARGRNYPSASGPDDFPGTT